MNPGLRPETMAKKRCFGPQTGPRAGQHALGPQPLHKHPNDGTRRFLREMALGALDPQTLRSISELVPIKRTFDNLVVEVSDFIVLRNMVRRAEFGLFFPTPKLSEKT